MVIIYNKTRQLLFVSVVRQTILGFEMTSNFRDTSPLTRKTIKLHTHSDSFRYAMQRKGGRTRSLGGFTSLSIDKKSVQFFFQEPP